MFIIDGVPYYVNDNRLTWSERSRRRREGIVDDELDFLLMINPFDIESVTVIRGGNTAALYGANRAIKALTKKR